jgi:hypothetical protein
VSAKIITENGVNYVETFYQDTNNQFVKSGRIPTSVVPPPLDFQDDFNDPSYTLTDGTVSPNSKWKCLYTGFGTVKTVRRSGGNGNYLYLSPRASTAPNQTAGAAVATTELFKDFDLTLDVVTIRLKIQGFQLEKKDNENKDDTAEIYLVTQNSPSVRLGLWQKWRIMVTGTDSGTPRIQVWIDGTQIVNYLDDKAPLNSEKMKRAGPVVLYTEDASVGFDNVVIKKL